MVDYFQAPEGSAGANNGAAPANGDTNMDDDVLVKLPNSVCSVTDLDSDLQFPSRGALRRELKSACREGVVGFQNALYNNSS
jgi:hypothetical protein